MTTREESPLTQHNEQVKKAALLVATLSAFLTPFMGSAINIALVQIGERFQLNAVTLSWVSTSFQLAAAVFLLPFGRLADLHGRKKVFLAGIIIFTAATLLCGCALNAPMLLIGRIVQGTGAAMIFANGVAILTSVYPLRERGRVLGINVATVYVGLAVGPFLGGLLTQALGWRAVFLATVPVGLAVILIIPWRLKGEWADARGERFDLIGSVIYGLGVTGLIAGTPLLPATPGLIVIAGGAAALLVFAAYERKVKQPVFNFNLLFSNRVFAFSNLAALINYSATFAVTFLMSLYLQYLKGLSPREAGVIMVAQPIVMAIFSPLAGRLSDRIEPFKVASLGMALSTAGLALLVFLSPNTSIYYVMGGLMTLGLGFALFSSPNTNAIMSSVDKRFLGIASGTVGTMRLLGQMLSMAAATLIFTLIIGKVRITPDLYPQFLQSLRLAFTLFAGLCFLGIFASLIRGNIHRAA